MTIWTTKLILNARSNPTEKKGIRLTDYEQHFEYSNCFEELPATDVKVCRTFNFTVGELAIKNFQQNL